MIQKRIQGKIFFHDFGRNSFFGFTQEILTKSARSAQLSTSKSHPKPGRPFFRPLRDKRGGTSVILLGFWCSLVLKQVFRTLRIDCAQKRRDRASISGRTGHKPKVHFFFENWSPIPGIWITLSIISHIVHRIYSTLPAIFLSHIQYTAYIVQFLVFF